MQQLRCHATRLSLFSSVNVSTKRQAKMLSIIETLLLVMGLRKRPCAIELERTPSQLKEGHERRREELCFHQHEFVTVHPLFKSVSDSNTLTLEK